MVLNALDAEKYDAFAVDCATLMPTADVRRQTSGVSADVAPEDLSSPHPVGLAPDASRLTPSLPPIGVPAVATTDLALAGDHRPDVAFIALHGRYGEDGTIQGMLELLGIPYTGSGVLASALAMSKVMSKKVFRAEGIPTPDSWVLAHPDEMEPLLARHAAGVERLPLPLVVKPNEQGSTIGITIVREEAELAPAIRTAFHHDSCVLLEQFVAGTEITAAVLGNRELEVLPLIEIVPQGGFYDYERKYTAGATDEIVPARIRPEETERARELAIQAHRALGCRGVSRVDMMVAPDGIWVLEVNTIPGMTPTSLLPRAAGAAGISFAQLLDRLIELALEGRVAEPTPCPAASCR
jgi:D-alanine-D-alanine ligase